ncbi:MAG: SIR2 family protein [Candidatus Micrarchaeota archaeon]
MNKVVYLFGAGATHAEKMYALRSDDVGDEGLLNADVSRRVISNFLTDEPGFLSEFGIDEKSSLEREKYKVLVGGNKKVAEKNVDIELLISLIQSIKTDKARQAAEKLRAAFREDIRFNLSQPSNPVNPMLYSSLLELSRINESNEQVLGYLTTNYDSLIDSAFKLLRQEIDYGAEVYNNEISSKSNVLLKLHGSFDWQMSANSNKLEINSLTDNHAVWVPPGLDKEYVSYPYNLLSGRARELLTNCDVLRIIGCSLHQNDFRLISLLHSTYCSRKPNSYTIDLVTTQTAYDDLAITRLGFAFKFKEHFIKRSEYVDFYGKDDRFSKNPFLDWLTFNRDLLERDSPSKLAETTYLKNLEWGF